MKCQNDNLAKVYYRKVCQIISWSVSQCVSDKPYMGRATSWTCWWCIICWRFQQTYFWYFACLTGRITWLLYVHGNSWSKAKRVSLTRRVKGVKVNRPLQPWELGDFSRLNIESLCHPTLLVFVMWKPNSLVSIEAVVLLPLFFKMASTCQTEWKTIFMP